MSLLFIAGLRISEPPFKIGDKVTWNEKLIKPHTLDRYVQIYGYGPFVVVNSDIHEDNFSGTITVKHGRRFLYMVRPKDLKSGYPLRNARQWNLHNFRKI